MRQKLFVGRHIGNGAGVGFVPGVQLGLQAVTISQQSGIFGGQVCHQLAKAIPEGAAVHAGSGQYLFIDKLVQLVSNLQASDSGALSH